MDFVSCIDIILNPEDPNFRDAEAYLTELKNSNPMEFINQLIAMISNEELAYDQRIHAMSLLTYPLRINKKQNGLEGLSAVPIDPTILQSVLQLTGSFLSSDDKKIRDLAKSIYVFYTINSGNVIPTPDGDGANDSNSIENTGIMMLVEQLSQEGISTELLAVYLSMISEITNCLTFDDIVPDIVYNLIQVLQARTDFNEQMMDDLFKSVVNVTSFYKFDENNAITYDFESALIELVQNYAQYQPKRCPMILSCVVMRSRKNLDKMAALGEIIYSFIAQGEEFHYFLDAYNLCFNPESDPAVIALIGDHFQDILQICLEEKSKEIEKDIDLDENDDLQDMFSLNYISPEANIETSVRYLFYAFQTNAQLKEEYLPFLFDFIAQNFASANPAEKYVACDLCLNYYQYNAYPEDVSPTPFEVAISAFTDENIHCCISGLDLLSICIDKTESFSSVPNYSDILQAIAELIHSEHALIRNKADRCAACLSKNNPDYALPFIIEYIQIIQGNEEEYDVKDALKHISNLSQNISEVQTSALLSEIFPFFQTLVGENGDDITIDQCCCLVANLCKKCASILNDDVLSAIFEFAKYLLENNFETQGASLLLSLASNDDIFNDESFSEFCIPIIVNNFPLASNAVEISLYSSLANKFSDKFGNEEIVVHIVKCIAKFFQRRDVDFNCKKDLKNCIVKLFKSFPDAVKSQLGLFTDSTSLFIFTISPTDSNLFVDQVTLTECIIEMLKDAKAIIKSLRSLFSLVYSQLCFSLSEGKGILTQYQALAYKIYEIIEYYLKFVSENQLEVDMEMFMIDQSNKEKIIAMLPNDVKERFNEICPAEP